MRDRFSIDVDMVVRGKSTRGITVIGIFLYFGSIMASIAGTTLVWRGTVLDKIWVLNATAYKQLAPLGRIVGVLFLVLGTALAIAGARLFKRRFWGWIRRADNRHSGSGGSGQFSHG